MDIKTVLEWKAYGHKKSRDILGFFYDVLTFRDRAIAFSSH